MHARDIQSEKVLFLYAGSPFLLAVGGMTAVMMVVLHWNLVPRNGLLIWLATMILGLLGRAGLVVFFRRLPEQDRALDAHWLWRFRLGTLASGLTWGVGAVFLCQSGDPVYETFVAFAMAGISAAAITALAIDRVATLFFVIPLLAPLSARFLLDPAELALTMGLIVLLFLLVLAVIATRIQAYLEENVRLRLQAESQQRQIQTNELRWRFAIEGSGQGLWDWEIEDWDLDTGRVFYSPMWKAMLGYAEDEIAPTLTEWKTRVHPEDLAAVHGVLMRHLDGESPFYESEHRMLCQDGGYKWILDRGQVIEQTPEGMPRRMIGVHIDVTERKQAEIELRIAAAVFNAQEGILITDANQVILRVNQAFIETTGYASEEVIGQTPRLLKSGRHDRDFYAAMWSSIDATGSWKGEIWNRRKNGEVYPEWLGITALKGGDGQVTHYVATLHDITERKAAEDAIQHLAFYDALTALPNRRLLLDRLEHAMIVSERTRQVGALLFLDLDRFKELNDTYGHATGDLLLQDVARRLLGAVRDVDTVARLGGDEFVVMLEDLGENTDDARNVAAEIGAKIRVELGEPYQLAEHRHLSTPSIGVILFQGRLASVDELLSRADLAMYRAKQSGRNRLCFFDLSMQVSVDARRALKDELRIGIGQGQFVLHFQPRVDRVGRLFGAEALVRWTHPERGMLSPSEFIPLAEESGLIQALGDWVLESACAQLQAWSRHPDWVRLTLAVNISDRQFRDANFVERILALLERTGVDPSLLDLELNESLLLQNPKGIVASLDALKAHGVRLTLDRFGSERSSLGVLKHLPLDRLKLDRSLVRDLPTDPKAAAIAKSVIALGDALGFEVTAVGVETEAERRFLEAHACPSFQGYLFSQALSSEELNSSLAASG
ncbi:putative bifunctional diguanylate cyclase/phosphodiesterase [Thiocystis violascens]|uniref:PAS domain S-box/diguanylate cyclase (GGDEF) domain-containing protein n=1 Tax=Thiocystis violascens (strain ATCC 17096 / DSM 198 / 6111) TaxID=765911 RepID=I3YCA7_THIV6|nr:GGDEF domain-containing phosphodiesterase [Thiocystis violascens]AFL74625.1 PAS domain S-box/diguanylate cyclase (GGDEF) domain-containing protein [Thiocystis violascens DSM 198]